MYNIFLPQNSATMFIKCDIKDSSICDIPDIITGIKKNDDNIKIGCVKNNKQDYMIDISNEKDYKNNIGNYYRSSISISLDEFKEQAEKQILFTVDLDINEMINLQYILVMDNFFKKNNIRYYLILETDDSDATMFKLYHYFNMKYDSIFNNVFIKTDGGINKFPHTVSNYMPGEILPYFIINHDFYKCCFESFEYKDTIINEIENGMPKSHLIDLIKQHYNIISNSQLYLIRYIYSCLLRNEKVPEKTIAFFTKHPNLPLIATVLFVAILNRGTFSNYDILYENCLDYAFSLEQLIENSLFYADNGILSMRIHQTNSNAMSKICKTNRYCRYLLEISLVDFQENLENRSIISTFLENADADEDEKEKLKKDFDKYDRLKNLFELEYQNAISTYFQKSTVLVQHYGLQTIGLLARKTNSLLVVRSNQDYYTKNGVEELFNEQLADMYKYRSGVCYRIIIPIKDEKSESIYIGFNNNKYGCKTIDKDYCYSNLICNECIVPKNRKDKIDNINTVKQILLKELSDKKILVISANSINNRLSLEYLIKAVLELLNENKTAKIAIVGFNNNTFIKIALRFITLCYNRYGINENFKSNELFLCTEDCKTQILISGENYEQLMKNLVSQRVFGIFDDDLFEEIKLTLKPFNRGDNK